MTTPEKRLVHRFTPGLRAHRLSMNRRFGIDVPWRQTGCVAARGPTADKTFRQIATGNIEMAEYPTQFTRSIQPTDRFIVRVEHPLIRIVHGATVSIRAN